MNKPNFLRNIGVVDSKKYIDFIKKYVIFSVNNNYDREKVFTNCKNYFLIEKGRVNNQETLEHFFEISEDIKKICTSTYGSGMIESIQFSLIPPRSKIKKHFDQGLSFSLSHRIHLPIITNDDVNFYIGGKLFNLKINQLVEFNNKKDHYVENNSDSDRIHLIIDFIPSQFFDYLT
jgi:hypothetical protein